MCYAHNDRSRQRRVDCRGEGEKWSRLGGGQDVQPRLLPGGSPPLGRGARAPPEVKTSVPPQGVAVQCRRVPGPSG